MRNNGSIFILTVFAAFAIGCGKTSAPDAQFDPVVRVAPEVAPQTRGSYTTETLKEFDLFIHSENSKYSYTNTKFTRNGSGEWEPARQMLWEGKNRKFKFLAVAPPLATSGHSLTDDPVFEFTVSLFRLPGAKPPTFFGRVREKMVLPRRIKNISRTGNSVLNLSIPFLF